MAVSAGTGVATGETGWGTGVGSGVFVGGTGVFVGGTGAGVLVGGTGVSVGTSVAGMGVLVGTGVSVKTGVSLGTAVSVSVGIGVADGGMGVLVNVGRGVRVARAANCCATGVFVAQARVTAVNKAAIIQILNRGLFSVCFANCFFNTEKFIKDIFIKTLFPKKMVVYVEQIPALKLIVYLPTCLSACRHTPLFKTTVQTLAWK